VIHDSTIVGNQAAFRGGGLTGIGVATTVAVVNTTIAANQAAGSPISVLRAEHRREHLDEIEKALARG